jgi:hypothetical protein
MPPPRGYRVRHDGQTFTSRRALAIHLSATLGKTENACKLALMRLGDDPEAVLDSYRPKLSFDGQAFHTQQELAEHIAPLTGRSYLTVLAKLREFDGDAIRLVEHYRTMDDISGFGELGRELRQSLREGGYSRLDDLTVLAKNNDPYRFDNPTSRAEGQWFASLFNRLVSTTAIHLRGFHYVLVSTTGIIKPDGQPYRNNFDNWRWLVAEASSAARWLDMVPFERIIDERNDPPVLPGDDDDEPGFTRELVSGDGALIPSLDEAMPSFSTMVTPHRQPYRIVLFGEKSSLGPVLGPIRDRVNGELLLPTGESTTTMVFNMAQRCVSDLRSAVILYFSDFDPAGWQMAISVARKLQALKTLRFPGLDVRLFPVALNYEQVVALDLPSTPLKPEELRADKWREAWGREQTEIDALAALNPDALTRIAEDFVAPFWDPTLERRTDQTARRVRRRATEVLANHPQYVANHERVEAALDEVGDAVASLEAAQADMMGELDDIELPPLPDLPKPVVSPDDEPEALFNSGDGYERATLKLKRHRALYTDDADE